MGVYHKVCLGESSSCDSRSPSSVRNTESSVVVTTPVAKVEFFSTVRNYECLLEVFKRMSVFQDRVNKFALQGDGGDSIGRVLSPQKVSSEDS